MEKLQGTRAASDDRVWSEFAWVEIAGLRLTHATGLIALQRLFAFMHDSHRSFVNIAEVTATFDVTSEISRPGGDPARELKCACLHRQGRTLSGRSETDISFISSAPDTGRVPARSQLRDC